MRYAVNGTRSGAPWKRWLLIIAMLLVVIAVASLLFMKSWYDSSLRPVSTDSDAATIEIVIESGESTSEIAERLEDNGIIQDARTFKWYVQRDAPNSSLQAGIYSLSPALSAKDIASLLAAGRVDTSLITILPGLTVADMRTSLIEQGFEASDVDEALKADYGADVLKSRPATADLEGYIFPESIIITSRSTPQDVISQLLAVFDERLSPEILAGIEEQGLSVYEAVTLASIVQKEISDPAVMPTVAQVFLKRLAEDEMLGSDVTFFYAAEKLGVAPAIDLDSPYNTRVFGGLPPGPISNFTLAALEAVAQPDATDYLFFVAGDDGVTYFSNTVAEHEANVSAHCIELCKLP